MLKISAELEDEYFGELTVEFSYQCFSGVGRGWFSPSELAEFAESLRDYPLGERAATGLKVEVSDRAEGELWISIRAKEIDRKGTIGVLVHINEKKCRLQDADSFWDNEAKVVIPVTYQSLTDFSNSIDSLLKGYIDCAVLTPD